MHLMRARELLRSGRGACAVLAAAAVLVPAGGRIDAARADETVLTIAKTDARASRAEKQLRPLAAYLADRLAGQGVSRVRTFIAPDTETLAFAMREGEVDLVFDSPRPAMICSKKADAVPLLIGSRDGSRNHYGLFFVREESAVDGLHGLAGRTVAVVSPSPVVEFGLPQFLRDTAGLDVKELPGPGVKPGAKEVGYVVAGSSLNVSAWVFYGKVDAGFVDSFDWQGEDRTPDAWRREFKVIHETEEATMSVVAVRRGMDESLRESVAAELMSMHDNPLGMAALKAYRVDYFSKLPPGELEDFEKMTLRELQGRRP